MPLAVPLAWLQLRKEPLRLLVAVSGVTFAVVLIFVQLGFEQALFDSAVRYHTNLGYDLAIISPKTDFIVRPTSFARSRLHQVRGFPGVARVSPIYLGLSGWRNPASPAESRTIFVVGFDPEQAPFDLPGVAPRARGPRGDRGRQPPGGDRGTVPARHLLRDRRQPDHQRPELPAPVPDA
jgi:putative ABC transport system permease protein